MRRFLSIFFILLGLISLSGSAYFYWQRVSPKRLSFDINDLEYFNQVYVSDRYPTVLKINDLSIELPVFPATIKNNIWQATTKGISYLSESPVPGDVGNSILYGHNWPSLLGNLTKAKVGESVEIIFSDGSAKKFVIRFIQEVNPNQSDILKPTSDTRITLYTCSGFFLDSKRFVVTAINQQD